MMTKTDILIIGSGIIGLSIAKELHEQQSELQITLLEKENSLALHTSGRNSGVIHAGFYYSPDSLKAKFAVEGNKLLTQFCLSHNIAINRCGKVVVTKNETELETLYELKRRGDKNGVTLEIIDENQLKSIEPNAKTYKFAIYSPATSTANPKEVVEFLAKKLLSSNTVNILLNEKYLKRENSNTIITNKQKIKYKYLINAAGLYADKIAHQFNAGLQYAILPFKGLYLEYKDSNLLNRHVYPVPDINMPFLGVHFTKTVDGKIKAGPTSIPAFWRENYEGISNFSLTELIEVLPTELRMFMNNLNFRNIALNEIKKYYRKYFIQNAASLVQTIDPAKFGSYLPPGIRAQLYDKTKKELVMDFIVEHGENSTHILNAVSPAFTCAFPFSRHAAQTIKQALSL